MSAERFSRTEMLLGAEALEKLASSRVAVFGVGGVGGYVVEALARSGVGALDLIDSDTVAESNINRQIIALGSTVGQYKVDAAAARVHDINPDCKVTVHRCFFLPETAGRFDFSLYDYVADAIDTVAGKLQIIEQAKAAGTPIISSMGAGNKLDPTRFEVADIYSTSVCPLAKVMRRECKARGIDSLKVVYSREPAITPLGAPSDAHQGGRRSTPGSISFVPSVAGLIMAGEIIKDLVDWKEEN
jgi:tRNA A37 threonylcarbamoyladenosine dehydratase